jgi:hypothetical protein
MRLSFTECVLTALWVFLLICVLVFLFMYRYGG